jgi:hypothetical protein
MVNLVKTLTYETLALIVGVSIPQKLALYNTLGIDFFHIQAELWMFEDPSCFAFG